MKTVDISSLPKIRFAHLHSADNYLISFEPRSRDIEVSYIAEGEVTIQKNNQSVTASKGDILCHIYDSTTTIKSDVFHCHHTVYANIDWKDTESPNGFYLPLLTKASSDTEEITKMIDMFIYKPYLYENAYAKSATVFMNILYQIDALNRNKEEFRQPEGHLLVTRAKKYIYKNIHNPITQSEVAEYLNITPQYLCNIFKKAEGISLIKYVNTAKLKNIQSLIEKENIKLYEAARLFGFSDANYVSYLYKKTFGRSITSKAEVIK